MLNTIKKKHYFHQVVPVVTFAAVTGVLTSVVVNLYKLCAKWAVVFSERGYHQLRERWFLIPVALVFMFVVAWLLARVYRNNVNLCGGGIPTSIGALRGLFPFGWLKNTAGVFILSLISFLLGVPLGSEGPSVQMGTALGRGSVYTITKKRRAWDRYAMTGGACAGFSVATGAPVSGILFAVEEAHQRVSPMILMAASTAVMFAHLTTELLAPVLGVSVSLFPSVHISRLSLSRIWIPIVIAVVFGLFSVLFLFYYRVIRHIVNDKLKSAGHRYILFAIFVLTLIAGLFSLSFISTGHELILELFEASPAVYMLLLMLFVRCTLTFCANTGRMTGGIFLPILAIGAVLSALIAKAIEIIPGVGGDYYGVILALGITACISGMMKMPLTATAFALEALGCSSNVLYVIVVAAVTFAITEIFDAKSINDVVLENRMETMHEEKTCKVIDTYVTVQADAFAAGKHIRDIFWPANLLVLSVQHARSQDSLVDEQGGRALCAGDVLHVRYTTYHDEQSREELLAIVGEQEYQSKEADAI